MPKRQYYDPMIEDGSPQEIVVRGFQVNIGGTYVLLDDIVSIIRDYAQSLEDPDAGALVHEIASWLASGTPPLNTPEPEVVEVDPEARFRDTDPGDMTPDVDRVEVFPDDEGKWYARSVDTGGNIMKTTHGSFDKEYVLKNAENRWPGKPIHEIANAMEDSMWKERGRMGPSPKRLWNAT